MMNAPRNVDDYFCLSRRLIERSQGVVKMTGKCSSIRLGETVFPLWAASKEMYSSSSAKYSKFKLSHADFAEHLLRFHIENSCSLCCADSYIGKYRNIGIQTEGEASFGQHQTKDTSDQKQTWNDKPAKLHFDHAYFTMDTTRMKNNKKPSRKRCLSLFPFQDVLPEANDDERDKSGDEDDDTTVTASERESEEDISLFPINLSKFGPSEEKKVSKCPADDLVRQEERRVQKQRDSVEGIISKIKQKMLGEEEGDKGSVCDAVASGSEGGGSVDDLYKDCVLSKMKTGIIGEEDEEDFITALYTMAAGNDVQCLAKMTDQPKMYPAQGVVKTITQQVGVKDVGISESKTLDAGGECQMMKVQKNNTLDVVCKEEGYKQLKEGRAGRSQSKMAKVAISLTNLPSIDRRQLMKTQRMLKRNLKKKVMETKKEKKKPIRKVPEKKIYRPHPRLDVQLAKLPKMYECKTCFVQLPEVDSMRSHYAAAHPKDDADATSRGGHQKPDAVTSSSLFPVLEFKQIATELRQCKECKEYVDNIKVHRRIHWVKRFVCDICGKGFVFKSILRKHQMYHNSQWRLFKSHKCSVCGKAYIDKTSLNAHILSSHNQGEKCFICEQCGKQFARKKSLAVHSDTHLKEKPFRCFECGRGFTQKNNMKLHMRTHTGVKPYRCSSCSKDFRHKVSLKTHQKKVHGIDWWKERERVKSDSKILNPESQQLEQQR